MCAAPIPLVSALPNCAPSSQLDVITIGVVAGEGIGPEVIDAALGVLAAACDAFDTQIALRFAPELASSDEYGLSLDAGLSEFYQSCFAEHIPVLHGPAGGRFVYQLRAQHQLPIKFTPVSPRPELADVSIVRPERLNDADLLIVRDNSSGLYQGDFGWHDDETAFHEARYQRAEVDRVIGVAVRAAAQRRQRLAVVLKPGGLPTISALWRESAERLATPDLALEFIEVDNACYQVVADPARFDVIATPNMFGDVVGDTASLLLASRGMSFSANFGVDGQAVYQTAHGAAHDLAGRNLANPVAQILTLALLLRSSLDRPLLADAIDAAVSQVLGAGYRTADIAGPTSVVLGTAELAEKIAEAVTQAAK